MSAVLSSGPTDLLSAFVLLLVTLCPLAFCMLSLPAIVKHEYRAFLEARIGVSHRRLMGDDGDELRDGDIEQQPRQKATEAMLLPDIKRPADQPSPTDLLASSPANLLYQARLDELDAAVGKPADVTANRKMAKSGTSSDKPSPDKPSPAALSNLGAVSHDKVRDELAQEQASSSQSTLLGSDSLLGPPMDKYSPRHLSHRAAESQHQAESQRHSQRRAAQEEASQRREAKEAAAREAAEVRAAAAKEAVEAREAAAREAAKSAKKVIADLADEDCDVNPFLAKEATVSRREAKAARADEAQPPEAAEAPDAAEDEAEEEAGENARATNVGTGRRRAEPRTRIHRSRRTST